MAKQTLVSIFDTAIKTYMPIQAVARIGGFERAVSDIVNGGDVSQPLAAHPEDYIVFGVGEFDDESGLIEPYRVPVQLFRVVDLAKPKS